MKDETKSTSAQRVVVPGERRKKRARTPEVFQMEAAECGAACLSMILGYYGCYLPMEELRQVCGVSRNGCTASGILRAGQHYGLVGGGFRCEPEKLAKAPKPCILHWNFDHFVVLEGFRDGRAIINDPAAGHRRVSAEELDRAFTGVMLCLEPGPGFQKQGKSHRLFEMAGERLRGEGGVFRYLFILNLVFLVSGVALPILTQILMDEVVAAGDPDWTVSIVLAMAVVYASNMLISFLQSSILLRLRLKLNTVTSYRLICHILRLPFAFFEQRYTGELAKREESNSAVNAHLAGSYLVTLVSLSNCLLYLGLMLLYDVRLTAWGLLGMALCLAVLLLTAEPLKNLSMKAQQDENQMNGRLCAGLSIYPSLKASGVGNDFVAELLGYYVNTTRSAQKMTQLHHILTSIPHAVSSMFNVLLLIIGSTMVIDGRLTVGVLTAFCMVYGQFMTPMIDFISMAQETQTMRANLANVQDIEQAKTDPRFDLPPESAAEPSGNSLELKNVSFGYDPTGSPLIRDLSLTVADGSRVAVVGPSGCGKSTLLKLAAGLLPAWRGEINCGGVPLSALPAEKLTKRLAVVNQKESFFSDTIENNLTLWDRGFEEKQLLKALQDAEALELVGGLQGGLEHELGEGGRSLSGGQRQQLAVARALIRSPGLLFLDEATSAMDPILEQKIMENLAGRKCTCLIAAHRLSAVRDCDLIVVMDHGAIVEAGTHESLMRQQGLYAAMYAAGGKKVQP